jgi:hypothetical protein
MQIASKLNVAQKMVITKIMQNNNGHDKGGMVKKKESNRYVSGKYGNMMIKV